jgi:ABC-2 type transport system permease protein
VIRWRPVYAVVERELLRMFRQRTRLAAAMVRPLIWLLVIGAGFAAVVGQTRGTDYTEFLVPGVLGMTMLFGAMLAALSTVYDKESGVMRMMVIAPLPHAWIVLAKTVSAAAAALLQALLLLAILAALGYVAPDAQWGLLALALVATSLACAGIGMVTACFSRSLDNFAGIMNFVIFPVFFLSGSLYPVRDLPHVLGWLATFNPYTYGVDLLKHALLPGAALGADFGATQDLAVLAGATALALAVASWRFSQEAAYEPMIHALTGRGR